MKIKEDSDASSYKVANYIISSVFVLLTVIGLMYSYTFLIYLFAPYVAPDDYPTFSGTVINVGRGTKGGRRIVVDNGKQRKAFNFSCRSSPVNIGDVITIASLDLIRDPIFVRPRTSIIRRGGAEVCRDGTVGLSNWKSSKILFSFLLTLHLLGAFYTLKLARSCATNRTFDFSLRWK